MRRSIFLVFAVSIFAAATYAQAKTPAFSQYRVTVEKAKAKAINSRRNPGARTFKTRLSDALRGGVNFAGHYIIVGWGCGTGCTNGAIIEARTGDVIWPEQFINIDASYGDGYSDEQLEFKKGSRLLVIHGRPGTADENAPAKPSGDYYYEWKHDRLRLLKFVEKTTN